MSTRLVFASIVGLISFIVITFLAVAYMQRPLFHDHFRFDERALFPRWHANAPLYDELGTFIYFDIKRNVIVSISTGDRDKGGYLLPLCPSPSRCVLLKGSLYETVVQDVRNKLIMVNKDHITTTSGLAVGMAAKCHVELNEMTRPLSGDLNAKLNDCLLGTGMDHE